MTQGDPHNESGELLIYRDDVGGTVRVLLEGESVWLTQAQIAELYQTTPQNVTQHLKAIYDEGELAESATCKDYLQVRQEGKRDVATAKNYLDTQEIDTLNRITVMFLDQAEFRAMRRQDIQMSDWEAFLDKFLGDTELPVLQGTGRVRHSQAQTWAEQQYDAFAERRRLEAEQQAEKGYLEDLRSSAKVLETQRKPKAKKQAPVKKRDAGKNKRKSDAE